MLNIQSKEGEISLIFSEGEQYYLVKRILKPGKSKDSCSSQLFSITFPTRPEGATPYDIGHRPMAGEGEEVVQRDTNLIADLTANPQRQVEEVVMKNETDLQQTLDQLLPPKSVFLSTMFLLQDAENIFEMQPADRLTVLKNVFGLLGIDEAKEQVQDKKRELSYKLKALQDHSQQDAKLRKRLRELHNNYLTLSSCHCEDGSGIGRSSLEHIEPFCSEIEPFLDQLTLNDFTLNGLDIQLFLSLQEQLQAKEKDLLAKQTIKDHLAKQIADHNNQITKREQEKKKLIADIAHLEKQIAGIDQAQIDKLKQEKAQLYEQQTALETLPIPVTFDNQPYTTLSDLYTLIQTLKERGKDLANQVQLAEQQLKALQRETELEAKNQQMKAEQLEQAKKRLTDFEISINEQATFSCEKI
ncbi:MAG: hypothetical protein LBG52_08760 [Candidatus Peribacteria bacterium]|jgi:DNA repair exonuclease SbcCD ATPase subunit|nr:hypothetical protein [Candidatus Peribacteria bacterium]